MPKSGHACDHAALWPTDLPSPNAIPAKFRSLTIQQRFTAATGSRKGISLEYEAYAKLFPQPLVLPGDELANDPKYPPQSLNSCMNEPARNELTPERKTVYVVDYPLIGSDAPRDHRRRKTPRDWTEPKKVAAAKSLLTQRPAIEDVLAYLGAFFHGLPVKILPDNLEIGSWIPDDHQCEPKRKRTSKVCVCELPEHIELRSAGINVGTRVRVRHLHDDEQCSAYQTQLNLNDLLDHAMAILPEDAYCLLMLVDHDLYEDDEDDFCCGRAYGGSRIAVVSSSQYQPALDKWHGVDLLLGHNWPGSHCRVFIEETCGLERRKNLVPGQTNGTVSSRNHKRQGGTSQADAIMIDDTSMLTDRSALELDTPLRAAVSTHYRLRASYQNPISRRMSYLRRVSLTASHELLHCFGLDHCVYFACAMQGTSSIAEDSRQPPYLCPVCENKLAKAVSKVSSRQVLATKLPDRDWWMGKEIRDWKRGRNEAMLAFCKTKGDDDLAFAPLAAWLEAQIKIEDHNQP